MMKRFQILQTVALFFIYLMVNITVAHALVISHDPLNDVTLSGADATIAWTTDADSDSRVDYGQDQGLSSSKSDTAQATGHSIILTGLEEAKTYYYKLTSSNSDEAAVDDNSGSLYSFMTSSAADNAPPQINATISEYYNRNQLTFGGQTKPDCVLRLYLNPSAADVGSDRYSQFTTSDSSGHFIFKYVNLQADNRLVIWAKDRDGRTGTAEYRVIVDTERPVVQLSDIPSLAADTSLNLNGTVNENVTLSYSVNDQQETQEIPAGKFGFQISLEEEGTNSIDLQFADRAGNVYEKEFSVDVDTEGPTITWTNLDALDPSYLQEIEIEGNVSKPGVTVVVFVNNQTYSTEGWSLSVRDTLLHLGSIISDGDYEYTTRADSSGHFKIKVFLTQEIKSQKSEYQIDVYQTSPTYGGYNSGGGYNNYQQGEQSDYGGYGGGPATYSTSDAGMGVVSTGPGGKLSHAWDNRIVIFVFDELNRTDQREGIVTFARCGYGADWNIFVDPDKITPTVVIPEHLKKGIAQIAFPVEMEWQGPGQKPRMLREPVIGQYMISEDMRSNYVFDPNELVSGVTAVWDQDMTRGYVILDLHQSDYTQKNITKIKIEDLVIKIPIELEAEYQYEDMSNQLQTAVQKQCWDISTTLDVKVPPSVVPKELLNSSIFLINKTIAAINAILKPLKAVTIIVFVTCILSWVMYFFALMKKAADCMSKDPEKDESCKQSTEEANTVQKYSNLICDRIFCPSVPLASVYFQDMASEECRGEALTSGMSAQDQGCGQEYMDQWDSGCLLMDELERSKCIAYETTRNADLKASCQGSMQNVWYGISDFCSEKVTDEDRMISIKRGRRGGSGSQDYDQVDEYIIDSNGNVMKIDSSTSVGQVTKNEQGRYDGYGTYTSSGTGTKESYVTAPLAEYSAGGRQVDVKYDEQGRLYYTGKDKKQHYLCTEDASGRIMEMNSPNLDDASCRGGSPDTLPPELMRAMELPGSRRYVVDPTDNLLTAIQCVCLPAISGFLVMWRNMLGAVMQCFQSILITGDGKTGLCREVLTVYICDLVFDAIRCMMNRYSVGQGSDEPRGGISAFIKSAATAGSDLENSIAGRYGETGLYNTMFNERKLIHAVCLYAFTGDFDFDIAGALTGAGAVPLKSKAFLYPRTRRFMASNPLTGYTTHIYHIGAGLVAGADIGYKLMLVCSADDSCDPREGFPEGKCDCYKLGQEWARDITYEFGPGRLVAGEMLGPNEGDIYAKISEDKYRYDKVRLIYWEEAIGSRQGRQEMIEMKITQIGGNAPSDCSFDMGAGEFRCAFDAGEKGYAMFSERPVADKEFYYLGERMNMMFKIDKRSPQPTREEQMYTTSFGQVPFYLAYSIESSVPGMSGQQKIFPIMQEGSQDPPIAIPDIMVTEEMLNGKGATQHYTVPTQKPPGAESKIVVSNLETPTIYSSQNPSEITSSESFAVYVRDTTPAAKKGETIKSQDRKFEVRVCTVEVREEPVSGVLMDRYYVGGSTTRMCTAGTTVTSDKPNSGSLHLDERPLYESMRITYNGMSADVSYKSVTKKWGGFIMQYKPPESEDATSLQCSTRYTTATPAIFNVKVSLHPCMKKDEDKPYSISNCDFDPTPVNYFGAVQEHTVQFKAVCSRTSGDQASFCPPNARTNFPCECKKDMIEGKLTGKNNCGLKDNEYCMFFVNDYRCEKYTACKKSTKKKAIPISSSTYATPIDINGDRYYCDCDGDQRMEDCTNKYCYNDGQNGYGCYPNPP